VFEATAKLCEGAAARPVGLGRALDCLDGMSNTVTEVSLPIPLHA